MTQAVNQTAATRQGDADGGDRHILALDGLRGLAILLVMQHHFWGLAFGLGSRSPSTGIDQFARRLFEVGWSGVDLFFVLSGFLITGILYDAKRSSGYFRSFYARRFLRIFPVYYAFLIVVLFILPLVPRIAGPLQIGQFRHTQLWFWTYMVNNASGIKQFHTQIAIGHSQFWSLAVEEQFYLLWPLLVLALSRRWMMGLCVALIAGALVVRYVLTDPVSASFANLNAAHVLLPARVDTLALGALLALAIRGGIDLARFQRHAYIVIGGAVAVLATLFFRHNGLSTLDKDVETIGFSALAFLFAGLLLLVLTARPGAPLHRIFTHPSLRFFGRYSYAIYVFHLVIAFDLAAEVVRRDALRTVFGSQIPWDIMFSLTCTVISVSAAWLSWHLFEKQVLKLKRYVPYGRATQPARGWPGAEPAVVLVTPDLGPLDLGPTAPSRQT